MSSEMRKELEQLADECDGLEGLGSGVIAQRIRHILARTEAGADGAVAHIHDYGDRVRVVWDKPWGDFPVGTQFYTHPQGASGDAEDARRYRWARDHVSGTAWNDDNFATVTIGVTVPKPRGTCAFDVTAEMLDAAIDSAMQAKEAK